ncbi:hypothetical protein LTR35_007054 [Friedmanniomyces endolithicus]|uniref:Uncharacterized protein n=1 Tax=Friedmanniomyces endolithicus TaxID=329885 RepID=A0AAN6FHC1_9PEZI|nr:hypothetical protein LTS00_015504 [Friedmanniomyces endolithicus]KAK0281957.1 hypothetical protein LTR35_007054 [Friedmanniomyces endolithicus]KAK0315998.1 hypothetical protein LTR82_012291 [Friedmanniomyces endolithicus]KAK1017307.1 hypothetical protein LTR54_002684 [Friedmanniomyces endolithicus]
MARYLTKAERTSFDDDGYLIIRDLLDSQETAKLQQWAQEIHDAPVDAASTLMPYEEIDARGRHILCRTENFANSHAELNSLLRGEELLSVLRDLSGEDMLLFKEKINYKLAGAGGYAAHIDSSAYTHVKKIKHLAVNIAVDPMTPSNGGLEVVKGSHKMHVPIAVDNCVEPAWTASNTWLAVELAAGDALIFGSSLAHRSAANTSRQDRKALYATYNCASEGDLHDEYYARRRAEWPPTHLRKPGETFEDGALRYGYGSPMISPALGHQLAV